MNCEKNSERIEWIDNAKGIGIILVMLGHTYLDLRYVFWFYSFHMALFFFLSGMTFNGKESYFEFLKKKARTLLIPYLFFVVVTMFCNCILSVTHGNSYDTIGVSLQYLIQNRYTPLWFITCLFLSEQVLYVLNKRIKTKATWLIGFIISFVLFVFYREFISISLVWNCDLVLTAIPFMCLGRWYSIQWSSKKYLMNKWYYILGGFILTVTISSINITIYECVDWYDNSYGNYILFLIAAISGVITTIGLSQRKSISVLTLLGKHSLLFYGLHRIIIDLVIVIYGKLGWDYPNTSFKYLFLAICNVVIAIIILTPANWFIIKYAPWLLGKKWHGKSFIERRQEGKC